MTKYYRVIKENFLWETGAILKEDGTYYEPIEDVWNTTKEQREVISLKIIESQPEYFERVYPGITDKAIYLTAEGIKKFYSKFKE